MASRCHSAFSRHIGLQRGNLCFQDFTLAFTLASLLHESVLLLQLLGLFMGLLSQPGRASKHSGGADIDVLQFKTVLVMRNSRI